MNKSKVLWVVFLGILALVLIVASQIKLYNIQITKKGTSAIDNGQQDKSINENAPISSTEQTPYEYEKMDGYHKAFLKGSDLYYYERSVDTFANEEFYKIDPNTKSMVKLISPYRHISFSLPTRFADITETAYGENYIYPLRSNRKIQINISVFSSDNNCSINGAPYDNIPTTLFPNKDKSITYSAILNATEEYRKNSQVGYINQGLVFKINRPTTSSQNMWGIKNLTLYPCVQIFPNPEDPELKKNHPEIYPEVLDTIKAIVESIRPIE